MTQVYPLRDCFIASCKLETLIITVLSFVGEISLIFECIKEAFPLRLQLSIVANWKCMYNYL